MLENRSLTALGAPGCGKTISYLLPGMIRAYQKSDNREVGKITTIFVLQTKDSCHNFYDLCKNMDKSLQKSGNPSFKKLKIQLLNSNSTDEKFEESLT